MLEFAHFSFPGVLLSVHFLDLSDEHGDIIRSIYSEFLKLMLCLLNSIFKFLHLSAKGLSESSKNFFVDAVILVVHFGLDGSIVNNDGPEVLFVFTGVKGFSSRPDLVKEFVASVNIIIKLLIYLKRIYIPKRLERSPLFCVCFRFFEHVLNCDVG